MTAGLLLDPSTFRAVLDRVNGYQINVLGPHSGVRLALFTPTGIDRASITIPGTNLRELIHAEESGSFTVVSGRKGWPTTWPFLLQAAEAALFRLRIRARLWDTNEWGCWLQAARVVSSNGKYARTDNPPRLPGMPKIPALHSISWTVYHGPRIPGLTIDHLCRHTLCAHPDHLEEVPGIENKRRALLPTLPPGPRWLTETKRLYALPEGTAA